ncbi:hypothetical protein HOLleu_18995 [Holothuria leucospilota]|uniref:Centriolar coiled-coil protein of 110 kDa-like n=1 Tax=Holothuria leucospilota TaxID=206669 RepID=A0A9Q1C4N6_HOLLE|nr:hypothetical protein HOLleu_18995 [Holothuria leucospilota]
MSLSITATEMDNILEEMQRCLDAISDGERQILTSSFISHPSNYQSCIKINGRPILPPLMTDERREEMRRYKEAAVQREKKLCTRKSHYRSNSSTESHEPKDTKVTLSSQDQDASIGSIGHGDDYLNEMSKQRTPELKECDETSKEQHPAMNSQFLADLSLDLPDNSDHPFAGLEKKILGEGDLKEKPAGLTDSLPSTVSSSEGSALNRTVINLSDLQEQIRDAERERVSKVDVTGEADASHENNDSVSKIEPNNSNQATSHNDQEIASTTPTSLRHSFSDSESFISFIGEYNKLPTPTPSSTPEVSEHGGSRLGGSQLEGETPNNTSSELVDKHVPKGSESQESPVDRFTPSNSQISTGILSTMGTNVSSLGSLGQSCTLPISVTASCDSTLADISERLDTPSFVEDLPLVKPVVIKEDESSGEMKYQSGSDTSVPSTVRRAPLGQEADSPEQGSAKDQSNMERGRPVEPEEVFMSPVRHVRRNSYTLDIPSPALLDAKARNEAPYAISLDTGETKSAADEGPGEEVIEEKNKEKQEGVIDEVALVSQLELLEEIKRRLEEEQKQQLKELMGRHTREQWLLQKEMLDVQRQVSASRASDRPQTAPSVIAPVTDDVQAFSGHITPGSTSVQDSLEKEIPKQTPLMTPLSTTSRNKYDSPGPYPTSWVDKMVGMEDHQMDSPSMVSLPWAPHTWTPDEVRSPVKSCLIDRVQGFTNGCLTEGAFYLKDEETSSERDINRAEMKSDQPVEIDPRFDKVTAVAKGFLTRQLMATARVQEVVKTIKDTTAFIFKFQTETPIKGGIISTQDAALAQRMLNQLRAAKFELDDIFHHLSAAGRMAILKQDRQIKEQPVNTRKSLVDDIPSRPLSAATLKSLERRKKAKEAEKQVFGNVQKTKGSQSRPKSAPSSRVLKQLQGHEAPSFPTRPVSSAAYRSNRITASSKHEGNPTVNRINSKQETEQGVKKGTNRDSTVTGQSTKSQSSVRRVLYPTVNTSKKKVQRKQAPRKPFRP